MKCDKMPEDKEFYRRPVKNGLTLYLNIPIPISDKHKITEDTKLKIVETKHGFEVTKED